MLKIIFVKFDICVHFCDWLPWCGQKLEGFWIGTVKPTFQFAEYVIKMADISLEDELVMQNWTEQIKFIMINEMNTAVVRHKGKSYF